MSKENFSFNLLHEDGLSRTGEISTFRGIFYQLSINKKLGRVRDRRNHWPLRRAFADHRRTAPQK